MELYCVQLGFLLGDDATIWYSIVWHRTVWYGEEEFGFVLDDNGFGGWHNWLVGGTIEQVAMRAGGNVSSVPPTICHPPP